MATIVLRTSGTSGTILGVPLSNAQVDANFDNLNKDKVEHNGSTPMTGKLTLVASGAGTASLRVPEGSADPTSPSTGDLWNKNGTLRLRLAGSTVDLITTGSTPNFAGDVGVGGNLTVAGNLTVNGTTTTINSTTISVDDKNIELGSVATPTDLTADGGGITLKGGTDKTLQWIQSTGSWWSSENFDLTVNKVYRINGTTVLSSNALGTGIVTAAGLTSIGQAAATLTIASTTLVADGSFTAAGDISLSTNTSLFRAKTTGGTSVKLLGLTNAVNNITRFYSGVDAGGFQWTNQAGDTSWASLTSAGLNVTGEVTAYATSDRSLKENITPIVGALAKLDQINGVSFDWTAEALVAKGGEDDYFVRKHDVGVIAQEIQSVLPEAVASRQDGILAVRYEKIVPLLIQAVKELKAEVEVLKNR